MQGAIMSDLRILSFLEIPLPIPAKTKLFLDQRDREKKEFRGMFMSLNESLQLTLV